MATLIVAMKRYLGFILSIQLAQVRYLTGFAFLIPRREQDSFFLEGNRMGIWAVLLCAARIFGIGKHAMLHRAVE